MSAGVVTVELTVTCFVLDADGPLQPVLTTFIITVPDHPLGQVNTPVAEFIALVNNVPVVFVILSRLHNSVPVTVELL